MPRRTSNKTKELKGTAQPVRIRKKTKTDDRIPAPGVKLAKDVEAAYYQIASHLLKAGTIMDGDSALILSAAKCLVRLRKFEERLDSMEEVAIQTFKTGARQIAPEYTAMEKERNAFLVLCKELGIGPKAREGIRAFEEDTEEETDPFAIDG
jgi:phage terminase small subunit